MIADAISISPYSFRKTDDREMAPCWRVRCSTALRAPDVERASRVVSRRVHARRSAHRDCRVRHDLDRHRPARVDCDRRRPCSTRADILDDHRRCQDGAPAIARLVGTSRRLREAPPSRGPIGRRISAPIRRQTMVPGSGPRRPAHWARTFRSMSTISTRTGDGWATETHLLPTRRSSAAGPSRGFPRIRIGRWSFRSS